MKRHIVACTISVGLLLSICLVNQGMALAHFRIVHESTPAKPLPLHQEPIGSTIVEETSPATYRSVNYYCPQPWWDFWKKWPETRDAMHRDMPVLHELGVNTVRIFVHPATFGWPADGPPGVPNETQLNQLDELLNILAQFKLKARLCLFDLFGEFDKIDESVRWMERLMGRFRKHAGLAMWELKNEVDMSNADVRRWILGCFPHFKRLAGPTPVSISVSAVKAKRFTWRATLQDLVTLTPFDFYDVHFYAWDDLVWVSPIEADILDAVDIVGPERLLIHEVGQSTFGEYSEALQRDTLKTIFYFGARAGVRHWGVWTYNDFVYGTRIGVNLAPESELGFGLCRLDGSKKLAAETVRSFFSGLPPSSPAAPTLYNSGFDDSDYRNGALEGWRSWRSDIGWGGAELIRDSGRLRSGISSARLTTTADAVAGFFNVPACAIRSGQTITAGGYVWMDNLPPGSNARLVASWHSDEGVWLGMDSYGNAVTSGGDLPHAWIPLSLTAEAPPGAAHLQLFVQVSCPLSGQFAWFDDFSMSVTQ